MSNPFRSYAALPIRCKFYKTQVATIPAWILPITMRKNFLEHFIQLSLTKRMLQRYRHYISEPSPGKSTSTQQSF